MKSLSRLPSDPDARIKALRPIVTRYEENGIFNTVYHRLLAEAEAEAAVEKTSPYTDEEE